MRFLNIPCSSLLQSHSSNTSRLQLMIDTMHYALYRTLCNILHYHTLCTIHYTPYTTQNTTDPRVFREHNYRFFYIEKVVVVVLTAAAVLLLLLLLLVVVVVVVVVVVIVIVVVVVMVVVEILPI